MSRPRKPKTCASSISDLRRTLLPAGAGVVVVALPPSCVVMGWERWRRVWGGEVGEILWWCCVGKSCVTKPGRGSVAVWRE